MPVLVNLAARANVRNDDIEAFHAKEDSKTSGSCRSLVVPARQGLRVLRVERIGLQPLDLLPQPVTGRRVALLEVLCGCPG